MWCLIVSIPDLCTPTYLGGCRRSDGGSVVVDSLLNVPSIVCVCVWALFLVIVLFCIN